MFEYINKDLLPTQELSSNQSDLILLWSFLNSHQPNMDWKNIELVIDTRKFEIKSELSESNKNTSLPKTTESELLEQNSKISFQKFHGVQTDYNDEITNRN